MSMSYSSLAFVGLLQEMTVVLLNVARHIICCILSMLLSDFKARVFL